MCLAVPGRVLSIEGDDPLLRSGRVDFAGIVKRVNLSYVPEATVGDYVLVHVGFAISTVDEEEARQVFAYLRAMGDLQELESVEASELEMNHRATGGSHANGAGHQGPRERACEGSGDEVPGVRK